MKPFTYVIAPEGGKGHLTPGKRYEVYEVLDIKRYKDLYSLRIFDDVGDKLFCISLRCPHLEYKDWIIPEIGQWPDGWSNQQKFDCVVRANVEPNFDVIQDWLEQGRSMREKNLTAFGWTIPIYKAVKWIAGLFMIAFMVACTQPDIKPEKNIRAMVDREQNK